MKRSIYLLIFLTILSILGIAQETPEHFFDHKIKLGYQNRVLPFVQTQTDYIDQLIKMLPEILKKDDSLTTYGIFLSLGTKYNNISQNDSALFYLDKAEKFLPNQLSTSKTFWDLSHQKANLYNRMGKYNQGLDYTISILKQINRINEPSKEIELAKAQVLGNIATYFFGTKQFDIANDYLEQMDKIVQTHKDTSMLVVYSMLKGIMMAEQPQGDITTALEYFERAKHMSIAKAIPEQAFRSFVNIAVSHYQTDQLDLALQNLQSAFRLSEVRKPYPVLAAYSTMGEIYFKIGDNDLSKNYLQIALKGAEQFQLKEIELYAHDYLYQVYKSENNYKQSMIHLEKFQELKTEFENKELSKELSELELKYQTAEKDKQIISKSLELEQQQSQFKSYSLITILVLLMLLILIVWLRMREVKQKSRIKVLQQNEQINSLKAIIQGEEQERIRIAEDLHDGIGAMVAAIKMDVSQLQQNNRTQINLQHIQKSLESTSKEIREVAHNLLPNALHQNTLKDALLSYCNKIALSHGIDISLQFEEHIPDPKNEIKLTIYRIFQELLQNIVKHAQASKAFIQVRQKSGKIRITVEDNGIGFQPSIVKYGLGLNNIKNRVLSLNGALEIDAQAGMGSTFFISFDAEII